MLAKKLKQKEKERNEQRRRMIENERSTHTSLVQDQRGTTEQEDVFAIIKERERQEREAVLNRNNNNNSYTYQEEDSEPTAPAIDTQPIQTKPIVTGTDIYLSVHLPTHQIFTFWFYLSICLSIYLSL